MTNLVDVVLSGDELCTVLHPTKPPNSKWVFNLQPGDVVAVHAYVDEKWTMVRATIQKVDCSEIPCKSLYTATGKRLSKTADVQKFLDKDLSAQTIQSGSHYKTAATKVTQSTQNEVRLSYVSDTKVLADKDALTLRFMYRLKLSVAYDFDSGSSLEASPTNLIVWPHGKLLAVLSSNSEIQKLTSYL